MSDEHIQVHNLDNKTNAPQSSTAWLPKVLTIAWREFCQTVFRKVFLLAILGIPLLILGGMVLMVVLMIGHEAPPLAGQLAVVDPTGEVIEAAKIEFDTEKIDEDRREQLEKNQKQTQEAMQNPEAMTMQQMTRPPQMNLGRGEVNIAIEAHQNREADLELLKQRIRDGELLAAAVFPSELLETSRGEDAPTRFDLYSGEKVNSENLSLIERRLGKAVVRARLARSAIAPEDALAMVDEPESNTHRLLAGGEQATENEGVREFRQLLPMAFFMLLWIATFTAGQHLMMSTIEEKSNRVMEVLLSAVSPLQLMTGKILGHGGVGLLIMAVYSALAIAGLVVVAFFQLIRPLDLVYLGIYFFMAYFMIASLMAAVGSAVSDIREANTLITPVMLILMLLWFLWLPISAEPNGLAGTIFSFVPPAIPFAMVLRLAAEEPVPLWQIPATIVWGYFCVFAMIWMASKIFRIGVLMYGKPPSPLELVKWLRYS